MRVKINKASKKVEDNDGPHELTNITVKEVSVVDRAANRKKFLVTKRDKNPRTETAIAFLKNRGLPKADDTSIVIEGDEPDTEATRLAKEAEDNELAEKDRIAKEAAEKERAETARLAKEAADKVVAAAVAPVVPPVDALKALDQLAADITPAVVAPVVPAKKDDMPAAVVVVETPAPLSSTAESVKASILAGIDQVASKVSDWRKAVEASDSKNTDQISGRPWAVWEYSYYISRMIDQVSNIGGADWEMLNATIGKELEASVTKSSNKAITAARVGVLKGVHVGLTHCVGTMDRVMKELTDEQPDQATAVDASSSFAKAATSSTAPAVVPAPAPAPAQDPAVTALIAKVEKMGEEHAAMLLIIKAQAADIAKAKGAVVSNALVDNGTKIEKASSDSGNLEWSEHIDMAPPRSVGVRRRSV